MSEEFSPTKVRNKQLRWGAIGVAIIFFLAYLWIGASDGGKPTEEAAKIKNININAPGAQIDDKEAWRGLADAQLRAMEQKIAELQETNKNKAPGQYNPPRLTAIPDAPFKAQANEPALGEDKAYRQTEAARVNDLNQQNRRDAILPPPPPTSQPRASGQGQLPVQEIVPTPRRIVTEAIKRPLDEQLKAGGAGASIKTDTERKKVGSFLPAGAFARATLLMGMDAPTGGQSQNNAQPVLLHVIDNATLPNHFRYQAKDCFIIGSGFGDLSSERAYIRTETLSCVLKDGTALEVPLKGHVAGEDGKVGLRGRLVSKQGQVLANALLSSVVAGIGQVFQQSAATQSVSPLGSINSVTPGKAFEAGAGAGVGNAMNRLAQYYIQTAEKMFPVIEIDAGRMVEVIITKGMTLAESAGDEDGQYNEISKRNQRVFRNDEY